MTMKVLSYVLSDLEISKLFALVDSGADVSVISETSFKRIKAAHILSFASTFDLTLKGVTGHGLQIVEKAKLKFQTGEQSVLHEFYVVNNSTKQMILGSDFSLPQVPELT